MSAPVKTDRAEQLGNERLGAFDFDGTQFQTSEEGAGIVSVDQAYAMVLEDLLGVGVADQFRETGHNHRTPAEIIQQLCPDMIPHEVDQHALRLIAGKKAVLLGQVGTRLADGALWPRPTEGFPDLWEDLANESRVTTAVISAGHVPIIKAVFDVHSLPEPDILVTDDVLVEEFDMGDVSPEERAKPAPLTLEVASTLWLARLGITDVISQGLDFDSVMRSHIVYAGDSEEKDGGLAASFGVDFVLVNPDQSFKNWQSFRQRIGLSSLSASGEVR